MFTVCILVVDERDNNNETDKTMKVKEMIAYLKKEGVSGEKMRTFTGAIAKETGATKEEVLVAIEEDTGMVTDPEAAALRRAREGRHGAADHSED